MKARWMELFDLEPVLGISMHVLKKDPKKTIRSLQRIDKHSAIVLMSDEVIVGYMLYDHSGDTLVIKHLVVVPEVRRQGGATTMVKFLLEAYKNKYKNNAKPVDAVVAERDFTAQKFFKSMGFKASEVLKDHFKSQDGYLFRFNHEPVTESAS